MKSLSEHCIFIHTLSSYSLSYSAPPLFSLAACLYFRQFPAFLHGVAVFDVCCSVIDCCRLFDDLILWIVAMPSPLKTPDASEINKRYSLPPSRQDFCFAIYMHIHLKVLTELFQQFRT